MLQRGAVAFLGHQLGLHPVLDALTRFKATNCDVFGCYLAAQAVASGIGVASFDKDFAKFTDVTLWDEKNED